MLISVPGIFESNKELSVDKDTNYAYTKFRDPHQTWAKLLEELPEGHRVLLVARHGQGFHNIAYVKYGEKAWDDYWSRLTGDETSEWFDAHLSPVGIEQVKRTGDLIFEKELGPHVVPDVFYCSPMRRCLETFKHSWSQKTSLNQEIDLHILENLRETLGEHTCDKRQTQKETLKEYGQETSDFMRLKDKKEYPIRLDYEPGFSNEDLLWLPDHRETDSEMDKRIESALSQIWELENAKKSSTNPENKLISITVHEGVIRTMLRVLKHEPIPFLETSGVVALVVKEQ